MELVELAVKNALNLGATEAEAYLQRVKAVRVEFAKEIENLKTVESMGIGLRVALGKRLAMYSTSILDENEIGEAAARAVKIAKVAPEDPHWKHMNRIFGKSSAEGYYDKTLSTLTYQEIVETIGYAIKLMKDHDRRVKPTIGILEIADTNTSLANSYNESCEREETYVAVWMRTKAEEAGMESTGSENQESRFWEEIKFENLAVRAAEKAVNFLKAKPIQSGEMSVIFRNKVFASILGVILSGPINADWVQKGRSPLSNKLGTQIASENINIHDDGLMHGGWRTKPFDDEGYPTRRTPVVERGILQNYLYDTYTALKDDVESTGNAQRPRYWVTPQPSPNNLILEPGEAMPEEIIHETMQGIYIEDTIGEWLSNPVSGNLNATVTHGYLVEDGELTEPIKGVVISGNFYELLKEGIEIIGNDPANNIQNYSPTVKATQLTIAGK
jgi:PmbA protein